jgi:hypothetical protein
VKAGFQHVGLDADLAFGRDHTALRHPASEIAAFFDRHLLRANVYKKARDHIPDNSQTYEP